MLEFIIILCSSSVMFHCNVLFHGFLCFEHFFTMWTMPCLLDLSIGINNLLCNKIESQSQTARKLLFLRASFFKNLSFLRPCFLGINNLLCNKIESQSQTARKLLFLRAFFFTNLSFLRPCFLSPCFLYHVFKPCFLIPCFFKTMFF